MAKHTYSKAYSKYGSSMGRRSDPLHAFAGATRGRLHRVPIDRGGYDPGGAYWGTPSNLWRAEAESADGAPSREAAKAKFPTSVKWMR